MSNETSSVVRPLPAAAREYLSMEALSPLWQTVRSRLEGNGLACSGTVAVVLDEAGAEGLAGLLRTSVAAGAVRVRLDRLDAALRASAAEQGLLAVTEHLHGPLIDKKAHQQSRAADAASVWARLEEGLAAAGLAGAGWVADWIAGVRRAGLLTRAGAHAPTLVEHTCAVLTELAPALTSATGASGQPPRWELAQLASRTTGDAHGLDTGTAAAALVLRAAAAATGHPVPTTAAARRELWTTVGVSPDAVSGTVLVWGLRPPGDGPWATMMRARADLGLVTHVTLQEWRQAASREPWVEPGKRVWACENPQVLQAAAGEGVRGPLLCLGGNPATVGAILVDALVAGGAELRYHGDFDPAGVSIAGRLYRRGVRPWRMFAADYRRALIQSTRSKLLPFTGTATCAWDPALADVMNRRLVAVHEEAVLDDLLSDLM